MSYNVTIPGNSSLDDINTMICAEEAGAAVFNTSTIDATNLNNTVTFDDATTVPDAPQLILQGTPVPSGKKMKWQGAMIVAGKNSAVRLYR